MGPNNTKSANGHKGVVVATSLEDAWDCAKAMKKQFGNGVSTQVIIHNRTSERLKWCAEDHYCGRWWSEPCPEIPAQQWGVCCHVKRQAAACGSGAYVKYQLQCTQGMVTLWCGWDTPFAGGSRLGIEVFPPHATPQDPIKITAESCTAVHKRIPYNTNTSVECTARYLVQETSVCILYEVEMIDTSDPAAEEAVRRRLVQAQAAGPT